MPKCASTPVMSGLTSSQSSVSVSSISSIKQRRHHPAADSLTFTLKPPELSFNGHRDGVSPLYIEPWDKLETCVHGTERHSHCDNCLQELEIIVTQCDQYLNSQND